MSVRLSEGVDLEAYRMRWRLSPARDRIAKLQQLGLLEVHADHLKATPRGRLVLNSIIAELADFAETPAVAVP
jgi:oxygen-independent coproporphyrinogen-3 oxidase